MSPPLGFRFPTKFCSLFDFAYNFPNIFHRGFDFPEGFLSELDWSREVQTLQKNMALGDAKHRRQVQVKLNISFCTKMFHKLRNSAFQDLFEDIKQGLADCLFSLSAQSGLKKQDALRLFGKIKQVQYTTRQARAFSPRAFVYR